MKSFLTIILLISINVCSLVMATEHNVDDISTESLELPGNTQNWNKQSRNVWGISEDQLDDLFENSSDYVALTDPEYMHRVNKRWTEGLGWSSQELLSNPYMYFIHNEDVDPTVAQVIKGIDISCMISYQNRIRCKNGGYHIVEWFSLHQVSGSAPGSLMLAIGKDITLEKAAIEQHYAIIRAQEATRLKSSFVAHMSHEIRTPLNGVLGFLEIALEEDLSETVRTYLEHAQTSSHFLLNVANDIIDISKIEANTLKIENVEFNPFRTIKSVLALTTLQAKKKNLFLTSTIDPKLPTVLCGDENRFKQILFNLIGNAIKFTKQGQISLKIKGQFKAGDPTAFMLRGVVKDTGIGIDPQFIPQMFQPFSQEDQNMRRQFGGAGLGLYITKQLCERLGGTIDVLSLPGQGSTFEFHIILKQPPIRSPRIDSLRLQEPELLLPSLSRILVVEDNIISQKVMANLLKKLGYEFDIVANGQLSLEAVKNIAYSLVLMDGEMPVMDGLDATREIRKHFSLTQLPIIGVSAHAMADHRKRFLDAGMNGYLVKPINKNVLSQEIARCFQELSLSNTL